MSLIKCPECGGNVSDKSPACIHCGYPLQEEPITSNYQVVLIDAGVNKIQVIAKIREITGKGLVETKELIDTPPYTIINNISKTTAEELQLNFKKLGAVVEIKSSNVVIRNPNDSILICPKCKSTNIAIGQRGYSVFSGFWGSNKTVNRCGKCGYSWQPKK